jgi:hypothetical protein
MTDPLFTEEYSLGFVNGLKHAAKLLLGGDDRVYTAETAGLVRAVHERAAQRIASEASRIEFGDVTGLIW